MKSLVIVTGIALALAQPVFAEDRCSDVPSGQLSANELQDCLTPPQPEPPQDYPPRHPSVVYDDDGQIEVRWFSRAEAERRAARPHNDPGAVPLCPPPHRMTRDGCQ